MILKIYDTIFASGRNMMENYPILYEEQTKHGNISFPCAVYTINAPIDETEKIYCHWHKEVELLYIMEGHAALTLDDHVIPVNQGDCIFIPSNHVHMVTGDHTLFCFTAVVFHPDLVRSFGSDAIEEMYITPLLQWQFDHSPIITTPFIQKQIHEIAQFLHTEPAGYQLCVKCALLSIFSDIYQTVRNTQIHAIRPYEEKITLIKAMIIYLQQKESEPVSLTEMADAFHLSKGHLCRFFHSMTNMSIIGYLNYYRINRCAHHLRQTSEPVSLIAGKYGFSNISYFNRMFRRYMHTTPGKYRKNRKGESHENTV